MFTGIIETIGNVKSIETSGGNKVFEIRSSISKELKVDQSVSHEGVCLTVTKKGRGSHFVTAVKETLERSTLGKLKPGSEVNLERCMPANGRFDGHIVQGHVDQTAKCINIQEAEGSWLLDFEYEPGPGNVTVEKGSICINGISLTCFNSTKSKFRVTIIPYTMENTTLKNLKKGDSVNLEFDIIGKYVQRIMDERKG